MSFCSTNCIYNAKLQHGLEPYIYARQHCRPFWLQQLSCIQIRNVNGDVHNLTNYNVIAPSPFDSLSFVPRYVYQLDTSASSSNISYHNNHVLINPPLEGPVINLSSFQLTPEMISVLSKGLNFCPMPGEPNRHELRQDLDKFHVSLRRKQFFDKCLGTSTQLDTTDTTLLHNTSSEDLDEPFGITKFSNPSTWCPLGPPNLETMLTLNEVNLNTILLYAPGSHNLNRSEQCTLAELQHVQSGVIKPADKGGISKKDYTNSMTSTR